MIASGKRCPAMSSASEALVVPTRVPAACNRSRGPGARCIVFDHENMRRCGCRASEPGNWFDGGDDLHRFSREVSVRPVHAPARDGQLEPEVSATACVVSTAILPPCCSMSRR